MSDGPKLCTSCEHHHDSAVADTVYHKCHKTVDVVTGKIKPTACSYVRASKALCGPYGKWYAEREVIRVVPAYDAPGIFDEPRVEFEDSVG